MSYKTDISFQKQQPPRESFVEYLKEQHQNSLQTIQNLEHKVQILQKSINHLQSRIKLKDNQILQATELLATKQNQIQQLKNSLTLLQTKNKTLKKQNMKAQQQTRQLQQLIEQQREVMNSLQNQRDYFMEKFEQNSQPSGREIHYLKQKNTKLEKQILKLQHQGSSINKQDYLKKQLEIEQLHVLLNKMNQELQSKNIICQQLKTQYDIINQANLALRQTFQNQSQHTDPSSRRKSTKVSLPPPQQQYNTNSSNRNKSLQINTDQRRVGSIKSKNNQDSIINQSGISQISKYKDLPKRKQQRKQIQDKYSKQQFAETMKRNNDQQSKKQSLLQALVARFEKLKNNSMTNSFN